MAARWEEFWGVLASVEGVSVQSFRHRKDWEHRWEKAKLLLREILGGEFYEEDLFVASSPDMVEKAVHDFVEKLPQEIKEKAIIFFAQVTIEELATGRLAESKLGAQAGTKLGKVFLNILGLDGAEKDRINSEFSGLLQKIRSEKLRVRISVDPLDFLMASEGTTGWTSCHSFGRAHFAGNVAYMFDATTVICYAYKSLTYVKGVQVPQKMWRQWAHVDLERGVLYFKREYPRELPHISSAVRKLLEKLVARHLLLDNPKWLLKENPPNELEYATDFAYCDPVVARVRLEDAKDGFTVVTANVTCPGCGSDLDYNSSVLCGYCAKRVECRFCCRLVSEDDGEWVEGEFYCYDCFNDLFTYCENCGTIVARDYAAFRGPDDQVYCEECYYDLFTSCHNCDEIIAREDALIGVDGYPYCENCFYDRFEFCAGCDKVGWKDELFEIDGGFFCNDCVNDLVAFGFITCKNCGGVFEEELAQDGLCPKCARRKISAQISE